MQVGLSKTAKTSRFQRSVVDDSGSIVKSLVFVEGSPLDITEAEFSAVAEDIGGPLAIYSGGIVDPVETHNTCYELAVAKWNAELKAADDQGRYPSEYVLLSHQKSALDAGPLQSKAVKKTTRRKSRKAQSNEETVGTE